MKRLILVCGLTGAGKTTYSNKLANEIDGIKFSIDPWMQRMFGKDMTSLDFDWMMERVNRCQEQILEVSQQIINNDGNVILDLGFTTRDQRNAVINQAKEFGAKPEIHYLEAPVETRRERVKKRNIEKDPEVYSFEVTDFMFNFMEPRFQVPEGDELELVTKVES